MAPENKGRITRRDFLGIATAGLGAAAGGVATSLITRSIDQAVQEASDMATESAPSADAPVDNVGTSGNPASSIANA